MNNNENKIWKTWDNREIPINQMETKHIKSAIRTIEQLVAKKHNLKHPNPEIVKLSMAEFPAYNHLVAEFEHRQNKYLKSSLAEQLVALRKK